MTNRPLLLSALATGLLVILAAPTQAAVPQRLAPSGSTSVQNLPSGSDVFQDPEIDSAVADDDDADATSTQINRTIAKGPGKGASVHSGQKVKSNPNLKQSFDALNFRNQRLANSGNQFSVEPPDQALAVGNGYVLEAVNDVLRIWDTGGVAQTSPIDLNSFYGYAAAINRTTGARGPSLTDPIAYFDTDTQRWFVVVLTLDHVGTSASLNGKNHLDIAVSDGPSPLGTWTIFKLPVQNDGTDGTPNHHCPGGACLGDYPHIGADANGIYLTTNEFPFFAGGFTGAQIIAISKAGLVSGGPATYVEFNTADAPYLLDLGDDGLAPGFTVWPATSPAGIYATQRNGTEYLLSSNAVFTTSGSDNRIRAWALTDTAALNGDASAVALSHTIVNVNTYGVPDRASQKTGDYPLGQCLSDSSCRPFIAGGAATFHPEGQLNSNDSRMQQVVYANGKIWGALDTDAIVDGVHRASIGWYVIQPQMTDTSFKAKNVLNGILGLTDTNLTYPAVAVTPSGRGVIGFTLVGPNNFPSAGYAGIDATTGAGAVHIAANGVGPQDGFTEYPDVGGSRPRWGDYGAAVPDGSSIWIASEYINQTCTLSEYEAGFNLALFGSCGGTRTSLGNWGTRITKITP
jgi:hypothetical protein